MSPRKPPDMGRARPRRQGASPLTTHYLIDHAKVIAQGTGPAGCVVTLGEARARRAERLALDHLDAVGACACWTSTRPRRCKGRRWTA